jgi:putative DNA primase/helicase
MEFIERLPLVKLHYLLSLSFKDYKPYDKSSSKNEDERKDNYNKMRNVCESFIKTNGTIKRLYKFTGDNNWGDDGQGAGRLFAVGSGIQGLPKKIRGFLLDGITTDIDMVNAHPVILRYLCRKHNLPHKELSFYIENRDEVLSQFSDRETGKTLFLKATNDDKLNKKEKNTIFKAYDKEMKATQKLLTKLTCYESIVADVPSNKLYNWYGSAMNRILCYYENKILQVIIDELNKRNIEICAPMFDGVMTYGVIDSTLLQELENSINKTFSQLDMKLSLKEHAKDIVMPDDFTLEDKPKIEIQELDTFDKVATEFEKTHCKITNKSIFVKTDGDKLIIMSRQQMKTSYEHMVYDKIVKRTNDEEVLSLNFINDWLVNNPTQRRFDDIGCYPTGIECPPNHFNSWIPFAMEFVKEYEHKSSELEIILNHIKILCGNDDEVYDYFIKWIAQMIQYPAVKSICPTLISKEGAGKTTLIQLLCKMLGNEKVFETATPSRDIWGDFNGRMANTFLVNLNELSKKETLESEGRIKALITDPKLTINNKGVSQYDINSHHRFIITTNNEEPVNTTKDDRRKVIIRSSDEKIGDKEYFNKLYSFLDDINVIKTCYEYFKAIPDMDAFNKIPMPCTEYQQNLKELSRSPIEMWLENLVYENWDKVRVELLGTETCKLFKEWCDSNNIKYEIDAKKLGVRLSNSNIDGIMKGRHTNKGWTKIYDIDKLKTHFKLSCVISLKPKVKFTTEINEEIEEIDY